MLSNRETKPLMICGDWASLFRSSFRKSATSLVSLCGKPMDSNNWTFVYAPGETEADSGFFIFHKNKIKLL